MHRVYLPQIAFYQQNVDDTDYDEENKAGKLGINCSWMSIRNSQYNICQVQPIKNPTQRNRQNIKF